MSQAIADVKPGDTVIHENSRGEGAYPEKVDKVTATQIVIGHRRYRRNSGVEIDSGPRYGRASIRLPNPGEVEGLHAAAEQRDAEAERKRAEHRESLRGRATGYLLGAYETAAAHVQVKPENAALEWLRSRLGRLCCDLEAAESDSLRAASSLRSQAEEVERAVKQDRGYAGSYYSSTMDYLRTEAKRVALREQGIAVMQLAELLLGAGFKELVGPFAEEEVGAAADPR